MTKIYNFIFFGFIGFFSEVSLLVQCILVAITIDFITGIAADIKRKRRAKEKFCIESSKLWRTAFKLGLSIIGVGFAYMIDEKVFPMVTLNLANIFAGVVIGSEFWSFLENSAELSEHPIFRQLKKVMKTKVDRVTGINEEKERKNN